MSRSAARAAATAKEPRQGGRGRGGDGGGVSDVQPAPPLMLQGKETVQCGMNRQSARSLPDVSVASKTEEAGYPVHDDDGGGRGGGADDNDEEEAEEEQDHDEANLRPATGNQKKCWEDNGVSGGPAPPRAGLGGERVGRCAAGRSVAARTDKDGAHAPAPAPAAAVVAPRRSDSVSGRQAPPGGSGGRCAGRGGARQGAVIGGVVRRRGCGAARRGGQGRKGAALCGEGRGGAVCAAQCAGGLRQGGTRRGEAGSAGGEGRGGGGGLASGEARRDEEGTSEQGGSRGSEQGRWGAARRRGVRCGRGECGTAYSEEWRAGWEGARAGGAESERGSKRASE